MRTPDPIPRTVDRLVNLLVESGPLHRAELARRLNLSRTRIGAVSADLLRRRVLAEDPTESERPLDGRAGPALTLSPGLGVVAGVQMATTHIDVVIETLAGKRISGQHRDLHTPLTRDEHFRAAAEMLQAGHLEAGSLPLRAVGLGTFGQIDLESGFLRTHRDHLAETWSGSNLRELCFRWFGVPGVVENNSRLEALAEATRGAGSKHTSMLYIHLGYGLAAVTVVNGNPLTGAHGGAGELGHVSIDVNGPLCPCGSRGCLGLTASGGAIQNKIGTAFAGDWQAAIQAARQGNQIVLHAFLDAADVLGIVIAGLSNLMDPDVIIVGGDLVHSGPRFMERLDTQFHDHALAASGRTQLLPATFGGMGPGGAWAAALLARRYAAQHLQIAEKKGSSPNGTELFDDE